MGSNSLATVVGAGREDMGSRLGAGPIGRWLKGHGVFELYAYIFARPKLLELNRILFRFSSRGLGYNLFGSFKHTGEEWFLKEVCSKFDIQVSFDIGANTGDYSDRLVALTDSKVHAFEPVAATFRRLCASANVQAELIIPHQCALGESDGEASILVNPDYDKTASIVEGAVELVPTERDDAKYRETVIVRSADSFCAEYGIDRLDFVKIDCEGYEREVLLGMQASLAELKPKFVQFEFNNAHLLRRHLLSSLIDLLPGYRVFRLLPRGLIPYSPVEPSDNLFMLSNHIAVRHDLVAELGL